MRGTLQKHHDPRYEAIASPFKDIEERSKYGGTENNAESPTFQHVNKVQGRGRLVETMFLFEDEGLI